MKKKVLSILFVVACLCLSLGLAACKGTAYAVTVQEGAGYTVQGINANGYNEGDEVTFTVTVTDDTKQLKEVSADEQVLTAQSNGGYKFTMPAKDVEISVALENKTPKLTLSSSSLVLNAKTADSETVTATVTPNQDALELEWVSADNSIASVTANGKTAEIPRLARATRR